MSTMEQVNRALLAKGMNHTRLLLITQSSIMQAVLEDEIRSGAWPSDVGHVIRHPRCFNLLFDHPALLAVPQEEPAVRQEILSNQLAKLKQQLATIQTFLRFTKKGVKPIGDDDVIATDLYQKLTQMNEEWRNTNRLLMTLGETAPSHLTAFQGEDSTRNAVRIIIQLIRDNQSFVELVQKRIADLTDKMDYTHDAMGFGLYSESLTQEEREQFGEKTGPLVLYASPHAIPYELSIDLLRKSGQITWKEITKFFSDISDPKLRYDNFLAIAVVLATLGEWGLAQHYCERALETAEDSPTVINTYEGLFFLAICLTRVFPRQWSNLQRARRILDQIEESACKNDPEHVDVRWQIERAHNIISCYRHFRDIVDDVIPDPQQALGLLGLVEAHLGDQDSVLLLRVRNYRISFKVDTGCLCRATAL